jgi:hypothetical protein
MFKVKEVKKFSRIELFFDDIPHPKVKKKLEEQNFICYGNEKCWYTKKTPESIKFIKKLKNKYEEKLNKKVGKVEKEKLEVRRVYKENSDYKLEGQNYELGMPITEIAKKIKAHLKESFSNTKWSVTTEKYSGGRTLNINLMEWNQEVFTPSFKRKNNNPGKLQLHNSIRSDGENLTLLAFELMRYVSKVANSFNYNDDDIQTDYFNSSFYLSMGIGKHNKKFKLVRK